MNRDTLVRKAQHIVAARRQKAITLAEEKSRQIYGAVPALATWQQSKTLAGIEAARLSAMGANREAVQEALDKMTALDLQRESLLAEHHLQAADFTPAFTCPVCCDKGYTEGQLCQCVEDLICSLRRQAVNEATPLSLCSFDRFDVTKYPATFLPELGVSMRAHMETIFAYCKAYAENFALHADSLYLCGYAGLGKTHLALSIAQDVLGKGYDVVYVSAQDAMDKIEKERFQSTAGNTMQTLLRAQLLILDDLGTEYLSPYISACLYDIINTRYSKQLPTIYTSNILDDATLRRRYTEKIVSRLLGSCHVLQFWGEDLRLSEK